MSRPKLGQKGRNSSTIRQESTVCYSKNFCPFVRLEAGHPEKYPQQSWRLPQAILSPGSSLPVRACHALRVPLCAYHAFDKTKRMVETPGTEKYHDERGVNTGIR